jgi:hypothetical protein
MINHTNNSQNACSQLVASTTFQSLPKRISFQIYYNSSQLLSCQHSLVYYDFGGTPGKWNCPTNSSSCVSSSGANESSFFQTLLGKSVETRIDCTNANRSWIGFHVVNSPARAYATYLGDAFSVKLVCRNLYHEVPCDGRALTGDIVTLFVTATISPYAPANACDVAQDVKLLENKLVETILDWTDKYKQLGSWSGNECTGQNLTQTLTPTSTTVYTAIPQYYAFATVLSTLPCNDTLAIACDTDEICVFPVALVPPNNMKRTKVCDDVMFSASKTAVLQAYYNNLVAIPFSDSNCTHIDFIDYEGSGYESANYTSYVNMTGAQIVILSFTLTGLRSASADNVMCSSFKGNYTNNTNAALEQSMLEDVGLFNGGTFYLMETETSDSLFNINSAFPLSTTEDVVQLTIGSFYLKGTQNSASTAIYENSTGIFLITQSYGLDGNTQTFVSPVSEVCSEQTCIKVLFDNELVLIPPVSSLINPKPAPVVSTQTSVETFTYTITVTASQSPTQSLNSTQTPDAQSEKIALTDGISTAHLQSTQSPSDELQQGHYSNISSSSHDSSYYSYLWLLAIPAGLCTMSLLSIGAVLGYRKFELNKPEELGGGGAGMIIQGAIGMSSRFIESQLQDSSSAPNERFSVVHMPEPLYPIQPPAPFHFIAPPSLTPQSTVGVGGAHGLSMEFSQTSSSVQSGLGAVPPVMLPPLPNLPGLIPELDPLEGF